MYVSRALIFLYVIIFSLHANATEEITFHIDIQGLQYQLSLIENSHLETKVNGLNPELLGKHYIGEVVGEENSWVRASIVNNRWQGVVSVHNAMHMFEHQVSQMNKSAQTSMRMQSIPMMEVEGLAGSCGDGSHGMLDHMSKMANKSSTITSSAQSAVAAATFAQFCSQEVNGICVIAEVEIAFDLEFQNVFGVLAAAQAMSILNIVDGHYINDLRISIDAITVEMLSNDLFNTSVAASPVLNAGDLLSDIENKKNNALIPFITNNSALTHLVTGRVFSGGTLGVAYLGSVCEANGFSTGTSGVYYSNIANPASYNIALTAVVVAHELAHNLGSDHDGPSANVLCPSSTYIMSPILGPGLTNFSNCSSADIEATLSSLVNPESCLDFPTDVSITEDIGNNQQLDVNSGFISSYTVNIENGFVSVDQINLNGSVNPLEGIFMSVTANGVNCAVAPDGSAYTCLINNPPASFSVLTEVQVIDPVLSTVSLTQSANEQTDEVQEVNAPNNTYVSTFNIENSVVTSSVSSPSPTPTTPLTPSNTDSEEEGGAGSIGIALFLLALLAFIKRNARFRTN